MNKVLFMGSDPISIPLLEALQKSTSIELAGILTQPDRPSGRGKKLKVNAIKSWAMDHGLNVRDPEKPSEQEVEWINDQKFDLALVMAYGHILKKGLLNAPPLGCWNFHASILPKHRGASPVESAILAGDTETGVSLMKIIPRMDAGPVLDVEKAPISDQDTSPSLREKLALACCPLIERNLPVLLSGSAHPNDQIETEATYCSKIYKEHGKLDFNKSAIELHRQSRAYFPWPGSYFDLGETRIKVSGPSISDSETQDQPGAVMKADSTGLHIATSKGIITYSHMQRPGGKMLAAEDFFRGFEISVGLNVSD